MPIPIGVDIKVLDHEYIKFLAILNANLKFKLKLKPLYLLDLCNDCEFANKVLKSAKESQNSMNFKKLDGLYKEKRKYMSEKGLLPKDKKRNF